MVRWVRTKVLGSGTYGTVYQAICEGYHKPIALKTTALSSSETLEKENKILDALFGCPEIINSHGTEITCEDGIIVSNLMMEYAPYGTLGDLIKKGPLMETRTTKVYIQMLLRGLSFMHQRGYVHCDLKPDNILMFPPYKYHDQRFNQLKIADFGLCKTPEESLNEEDWKFSFRGTPSYMSPESIACGQIGPALDIWSFGCVVLEMFTGYSWWVMEHCSLEDIMVRVGINNEAPSIPSGLSSLCKDFLQKCFIANPNERWTADMLLHNHPFTHIC
ncbi:mitogen-activated protein kinase kinase kinase 17-like [Abrus precatorius]|uniref:Mitogen-activated protein kinase kinase kinase 17-like n=1 Tax=Abrus precatorius TaxID=3816 RepID=A0A8B8K287_ABRPR|nr:mitogen-activated protein kinase kinase kinase 17-like [Abrus precatorius]